MAVGSGFVQVGNGNTQHYHFYGTRGSRSPVQRGGGEAVPGYFELFSELAGRDENAALANAVHEEAERRAAGAVSPLRDLSAFWRLVPLVEQGNWRLRRAFGYCIGQALAAAGHGDPLVDSVVHAFVDYAKGSAHFGVVLSIASTASRRAGRTFGPDTCRRLFSSPHPQVLWQYSRNPFSFASPAETRLLVDAVLDRSDLWIRRRLVLSSMLDAGLHGIGNVASQESLVRLLQSLGDEDGEYLVRLGSWLLSRGKGEVLDLLPRKDAFSGENGADVPAGSGLLTDGGAKAVRAQLETISLDLDAQRMVDEGGRAAPMPAGEEGRGRYSRIEDATAFVISTTPAVVRYELAAELLDSYDEGIRWAVASQLGQVVKRHEVTDVELPVVIKLLRDAHPWVVREALTSVERLELPIGQTHFDQLAKHVIGAVSRTERLGWPRSEVFPAVARLLAASSEIALRTRVDVVMDDDGEGGRGDIAGDEV